MASKFYDVGFLKNPNVIKSITQHVSESISPQSSIYDSSMSDDKHKGKHIKLVKRKHGKLDSNHHRYDVTKEFIQKEETVVKKEFMLKMKTVTHKRSVLKKESMIEKKSTIEKESLENGKQIHRIVRIKEREISMDSSQKDAFKGNPYTFFNKYTKPKQPGLKTRLYNKTQREANAKKKKFNDLDVEDIYRNIACCTKSLPEKDILLDENAGAYFYFIEMNEYLLRHFTRMDDLEELKYTLIIYPHLISIHSIKFLISWAMELEVIEFHNLKEMVLRQCVIINGLVKFVQILNYNAIFFTSFYIDEIEKMQKNPETKHMIENQVRIMEAEVKRRVKDENKLFSKIKYPL